VALQHQVLTPVHAGLIGRVIIVGSTDLPHTSCGWGCAPGVSALSADAFGRGPDWPRDYRRFDEFAAYELRLGVAPGVAASSADAFGREPKWPRNYRLWVLESRRGELSHTHAHLHEPAQAAPACSRRPRHRSEGLTVGRGHPPHSSRGRGQYSAGNTVGRGRRPAGTLFADTLQREG
jgi:hypothetical protein